MLLWGGAKRLELDGLAEESDGERGDERGED